ncbi:MAG: FG-GAP-like repeat-containing protein [Phycisphaerales bacterium]
MSSVPDADGDGTDDLLLGTRGSGGGAWLCSGRTGLLLRTWTSPDPTTFGQFGTAGAGIRDVDGDGAGDVIIGDYSIGRVYVFSGRTGALIHTLQYSTPGGGFFGTAVAAVPDTDGDGYDDIVVGSSTDGGRGLAYIFSGHTGAELVRLVTPVPYVQGSFGAAVAGLDDLDGDGRGDVLVGAPNEGEGVGYEHGQAHLYSGATGAYIRLVPSPVVPARQFGLHLARLSDINGDGHGDYMIGGPNHPGANGVRPEGALYLFSGQDGTLIRTLHSPHEEWSGSLFGNGAFVEAPDLNRDRVPDLLVGHGYLGDLPNEPIYSGRAFVFSGTSGEVQRTYRSPMPNPIMEGSGFGAYVNVLPSTFGDRIPEIAVMAANDCGGECGCNCTSEPRGVTYIFNSCPVDLNYNGRADSADFFAFLTDLFGDGPHADFNGDGRVNSQDFFDFLARFFMGCREG